MDFTLATLAVVESGDSVSINSSSYTANFNNKNVGNAKPVTVIGVTLSGGDAGNYTVSQPNGLTADITAASLDIYATTESKSYDGTTSSSATPTTSGLQTGDTVTGLTQAFQSKNVLGVNGSTLEVTAYTVNDGNSGNNYSVTTHTATGTISTLALTINAVADSKTYDGNATSSGVPSFVTLVGGDTGTAVQVFDGRNAGTRTLSVSSYTISDGNGGANYGPVTTHTAAGSISTLALAINAVADSKTYDGNATSSGVPSFVTLVGGDTELRCRCSTAGTQGRGRCRYRATRSAMATEVPTTVR